MAGEKHQQVPIYYITYMLIDSTIYLRNIYNFESLYDL